jgi:hypothetical protein
VRDPDVHDDNRPATGPLPPDALAAVAEIADARLTASPDDGPCLVRVRLLHDDVELGWLPLRGQHPLTELAGATAPPDWCAIGVATTGRAHAVDDPAAPPVPIRTAHLVGRDGSWASRYSPIEPGALAPASTCGPAGDRRQPLGRIDDSCRRALGLPTEAPDGDTTRLWALQWLDAVLDRVATVAGVTRWGEVASLHPAARALRSDAQSVGPGELAALAGRLAAWRDWPVLRRACAAGAWSAPELEPQVAAWLDDGSFSRWVLGAYPELEELVGAVEGVLAPDLAAAVGTVLTGCGMEGGGGR